MYQLTTKAYVGDFVEIFKSIENPATSFLNNNFSVPMPMKCQLTARHHDFIVTCENFHRAFRSLIALKYESVLLPKPPFQK